MPTPAKTTTSGCMFKNYLCAQKVYAWGTKKVKTEAWKYVINVIFKNNNKVSTRQTLLNSYHGICTQCLEEIYKLIASGDKCELVPVWNPGSLDQSEIFPLVHDVNNNVIGLEKSDEHPSEYFGDDDSLVNLDPNGEFVISTRVRCGRSLQGYPFNPCLTEAQYKEIEMKVSITFGSLSGELKGTYYPLTGMTKEVQQQLIDDHFLFKEGDRFLQAANACRYWPTGRGIYHNDDNTFLVRVNEEDHLRIISMQEGGDLGTVYKRMEAGVNEIEKTLPFSRSDRLRIRYGRTVCASVHIKLPKMAADKAQLDATAAKYKLQVRRTRGEHSDLEGSVYISNRPRLGLTEYEVVKEMEQGILELIKIEKSL